MSVPKRFKTKQQKYKLVHIQQILLKKILIKKLKKYSKHSSIVVLQQPSKLLMSVRFRPMLYA